MIIAVFLDSINFKHVDKSLKHVFLFYVKDEVITEIGENLLTMMNVNYLVLWLMSKKVEFIYIDNIDDNTKNILEKYGITIKNLDDIKENPILKSLLLKKENKNK